MHSSMAYPTLGPTELEFLRRFYDTKRTERGFEDDSFAARDLAARIMLHYQNGARTESELTHHLAA